MGVVGFLGVTKGKLIRYSYMGVRDIPLEDKHLGMVLARCMGLQDIEKGQGLYSWLSQGQGH